MAILSYAMAMMMINSLQLAPHASLPVLAPLKKRRAMSHGQSFWRGSRIRMPAAPESTTSFTFQMASQGDGTMHASSSGHGVRRRGIFSNSNSNSNFLPRAQVPASAQNPSHSQEEVGRFYRDMNVFLVFFLFIIVHLHIFCKIIEVQLITSQKTMGIATQWT